jgi:nitrogen-specific signal transduction histidine kinase/ActR/RegA family two-component response regulator
MWQTIGLAIIGAMLFTLLQAMEGQARAEAQLREAQKMEAVGQLAGGVAHDFNNLLTVIGGHVFMLEQIGQLGPGATKHLDGITKTTERAGSLTRQLLAFGRRQVLHPTVVDLNAVVRDAAQLLAPVVGERIEVVTILEPALAPVHADVGQLEQVLLNLGLNARDAMPNGGTLRITTSNVDAPEGPQVRVTFEDCGVGMDAKTMARVFEPFFTTKSGGRGTGLGLATAYGIIKQSSGDLTVVSTPGHGSTFTIILPAARTQSVPAVRVGEGAPAIARPLGIARVLLVEDNDGVRDFAREVLTRSGVTVSVASDGAEGLEVARRSGYAFDLIVTDIVMPGLSGTQMIERLREVRPEIPVLFMPGYADDPITRQDLQAGREALIEKPFSARALREAIQAITAARQDQPVGIP